MKVAIYVRVSTGKQELANQIKPLIELARRQSHEVVHVYQDVVTGSTSDRAGFKAMMQAAHEGKFKAIVVWALDRLTREGLSKTINLMEYLAKNGIGIISHTEPYLDTTNELARNILLAVISTFAKAEREKIGERTRAGLARLKAEGKQLGRPSLAAAVKDQAAALLRSGQGVRSISRELKISLGYVSQLKKGVHKRGVKNSLPLTVGSVKSKRVFI